MAIRNITIIGTGLIGGSLGLALKEHGFRGRIVGSDRTAVLQRARAKGAIDDGINDPAEHPLRFDELFQAVDIEYLRSINGINNSRCTMADGTAGTSTVRYVIVEALATNYRGSIVPSDAAEAYAELLVFTPEP